VFHTELTYAKQIIMHSLRYIDHLKFTSLQWWW